MEILFLVYFILGYWAANQTIVRIGFFWDFFGPTVGSFGFKAAWGTFFGWLLIPIAILKLLFFRRKRG